MVQNSLVRFALVALFPRDGDLPGLEDLDLDAKIDKLRRETTRLFWTGLVAAAIFFQITPIVTVRRPWLAVMLTPDELDEHANKIASSNVYLIRQIIVLIKLIGGAFWGQSDQVRAFLHLPAYPEDPGTRRTEKMVARPRELPREPSPKLVPLGRREEERGRVVTEEARRHGIDVDHHPGAEA